MEVSEAAMLGMPITSHQGVPDAASRPFLTPDPDSEPRGPHVDHGLSETGLRSFRVHVLAHGSNGARFWVPRGREVQAA